MKDTLTSVDIPEVFQFVEKVTEIYGGMVFLLRKSKCLPAKTLLEGSFKLKLNHQKRRKNCKGKIDSVFWYFLIWLDY